MSTAEVENLPSEVAEVQGEIEQLDTAEKRFAQLSRNFVSSIAIIAKMQENRDWETLRKEDGSEYKSLTEMVQDALNISDSYARRLVQTADNFYSPLEAVTVDGTVISITANQAAALGTEGMNDVVERVKEGASDEDVPEYQSALIDEATNEVLSDKKKVDRDDFDDFGDDFDDTSIDEELEDDDDFPDDFPDDFADVGSGDAGSSAPAGDSGGGSESSGSEKKSTKKSDGEGDSSSSESKDYLQPIERIMSGGKEYNDDEAIETLPEELQEFVRAVNYLANIDPEDISNLITRERRGATYNIQKASSQLTLVRSSTEVSGWVLDQL